MLFNKLHNNSLTTIIAVPFIVILLWMRLFTVDMANITALDNPAMPIWNTFILPWLGHSQFIAALTSLLLVVLSGLSVNRIATKHGLLYAQSMITLLTFSLMVSAFLSVQKLNPVLFYLLFFTHGLERILGQSEGRVVNHCFDAAFLIGIGSLIYIKGLFIFPFILVAMGILRILNLQNILSALAGLLLPFILSFTYFFMLDQLPWFLHEIQENILANPGQYNHTLFSQFFIASTILLLALAMLSTVRSLPLRKVKVRFYFRIFIWMLLLTTGILLTPFFSMEILPIASVGASVLLASFFERIVNNKIREVLFALFVALIISGQFFLF
ncbi:MAG TPA: hypothetical protein VJ855_01940 [Marinilabiliaceae bacterium]|nr:hypothetical protein [Marinilabiliaceae bacterium]